MAHASTSSSKEPSYITKQRLNGELVSIDAEITSINEDIDRLIALRLELEDRKHDVQRQLSQFDTLQSHHVEPSKAIGKRKRDDGIDYSEEFEWSPGLRSTMKRVFGIQSFRLCQAGVCNANMDGRNIVCVMPTGGGKSLTYQLPALLNPGCTLVISPLISLITDQILHLQDAGVEAVKLTGITSKEESRSILTRLNPANSRLGADGHPEKEIKLCYVTPEKIAKSKTFMSVLEKMYKGGKLARIVIDEAHCVSQIGHDFRPDYKRLNILKQLFPKVPIMALSATCPPTVLKDLLLNLRLREVTDGNAANRDGTVYFTSPLYRKNLHYKVVAKPAAAAGVIEAMSEYILGQHRDDSGIVYCLSKKDTESVAEGLREVSSGKIKTGIYHADCSASEKETLHKNWRQGKIKVVCATIAFGLGIDKGDVRFVLHHSISKSLDGFYQESGRAGRDGADADCVLYYRPQDLTRLSALVCGEVEGQEKLHGMLAFAQSKAECRKLLFANYFSTTVSTAAAWTADSSDATKSCGHCDNCTRPPEEVERRNRTLEAWQILQVARAIHSEGGYVTVGMLADLVRGAGGGAFSVSSGSGGKKRKSLSKEKVGLDLDAIAGGKISLGKEETEALIIDLLLDHYLKETFSTTAYAINVYVAPGSNALRLSRLSRDAVVEGQGPKIEMTVIKKPTTRRPRKSLPTSTAGSTKQKESVPNPDEPEWPPRRKKSRLNASSSADASTGTGLRRLFELGDESDLEDLAGEPSAEVISLDGDSDPQSSTTLFSRSNAKQPAKYEDTILAEDSASDMDADFTFTLDGRPLQHSRAQTKPPPKTVEIIDIPSSPEP